MAFWCGGSAVLAGQNPYFDRSIHDCQTTHGLISALTIPVPYPPYALAVFAALATLPEPIAFALFCAALVAAAALTCVGLMRLTGLAWHVPAAACALLLLPSLETGQVALFAICAFTWALVFVRERRPVPTTAALAAMALLPNFALASWLSAIACVGRLRAPLAVAAASLAALGWFVLGLPGWLSYIALLRSFSQAESSWFAQVGLAPLVAATHAPPALAAAISWALFAGFVILGLWCGLRLRAAYGGDEWVIATATAFAVAGAPFLHGWDVGFALPLATMLWARSPGRITGCALLLIATPWQQLVEHAGIASAIALPLLIVLADETLLARPIVSAAVASAISLLALTLFSFANAAGESVARSDARFTPPPIQAGALADVRYAAFARQSRRSGWQERVPTLASLFWLVLVAFGDVRRK